MYLKKYILIALAVVIIFAIGFIVGGLVSPIPSHFRYTGIDKENVTLTWYQNGNKYTKRYGDLTYKPMFNMYPVGMIGATD